jgi:hypothetical protein
MQYNLHLRKNGSFMDNILVFMGQSMKEDNKKDAAGCLLQYFYDNFEEQFK